MRQPNHHRSFLSRHRVFCLAVLLCSFAATSASAQMATGTYVGDGLLTKSITDVGFSPDLIIIKSDGDQPAVLTTSDMAAGWGKEFPWIAWPSSLFFSSIDPDGFSVLSSDRVNRGGRRYDWTAFKADPGRMVVGTYGGDRVDDRLIDLGFRPDYVMVIPNDDAQALQRSDLMPDFFCLAFDDEGSFSNHVQSFTDQGFVIGDDVGVNGIGTTYYYAAWRAEPIQTLSGTYVGSGSDNRNINSLGFLPEWVVLKPDSADDGTHMTGSLDGVGKSLYFGHKKNDANRIQNLNGSGFQVGNDKDVNEDGVTYYWTSFGTSTDFVVGMSADRDTAYVGDQVVFTVTLDNIGPDRSVGVAVSDLLPAGFGHVSSAPTAGTYLSASGAWSLSRLEAGASAQLVLTADVLAGSAGQTLVNKASVSSFEDNDPDLLNNSASASVYIPGAADLAVSGLIDDPTPVGGQVVNIVVGAENIGPEAAVNVQVDAILPAGLEYVSHLEILGSYDPISGYWDISTLGALSTSALQIQARVATDVAGQTLSLPLTISSAVFDPVPLNNTSSVSMNVLGADLELEMIVDEPAPAPGDAVRFTLILANAGPDDVDSIVVNDLVPVGLQHNWSVPSQGVYNPVSGDWAVGSLSSGSSVTLVIDMEVVAVVAGVITNNAAVTAASLPDPDPLDDVAGVDIDVQGNDIAVSLSVDNDAPNVGDVVTFTVTTENVGFMNATSLAVADTLPSGMTFVSATPSQGSYDPVSGIWTIGDLDRGSSCVLLLGARLDAGTGGSSLSDVAKVVAVDQPDGDLLNNAAVAAVTVRAVQLRLIKSVDDPAPVQNDDVAFTILVANSGPDDATGVAVADTLPAGLAYVSSTADRGSYDPLTGLWDVGAIALGDTARLDMVVNVQLDVGGGDSAVNTARITSSDQEDPDPSNDLDSAELTQQSSDLNLTAVVDDATPASGDVVRFTLTLRNDGPSDVHGVVVRDTLAAGLTYLSHAPSGFAYDDATGLWTVGDLTVGATVVLSIDAEVGASTSGDHIVNEAEVSAADQADPDGTDNRAQTALDVRSADQDLSWLIASPTPTVGDIVTARLEWTNAGPDILAAAVVDVRLPAGLTLDGATPLDGTWDGPAGTWSLSGLGVGSTTRLDVDLIVDPGTIGTVLTLEAEAVSARPGDPTPATGPATAEISVLGADLALAMTANVGNADVGETVLYTLTVSNDGPDVESGVAVRDSLPAGLTYVAHTPAWADYDPLDGIWNVGPLQVGESAVLLLQTSLSVAAPGDVVVNEAAVWTRTLADPDPLNDVAQWSLSVPSSDLGLDLTAWPEEPAMGDEVAVSLNVVNNGPQDATGAVMDLLLPDGLMFVSSEAADYDAVAGRWFVGDLRSGDSRTLNLIAAVAQGTAEDTIRVVSSVAEVDQGDPVIANDVSAALLTVRPDADLTVSLTASQTSADVGDTLVWTAVIENLGISTAAGIAVNDSLPIGANLVDWVADEGAYDGGGHWTVGQLSPGGRASLQLRAVLLAGVGGTDLTGSVRVATSSVADQNATNNRDEQTIHVSGADLVLETFVDVEAPGEGDNVNITLSVMNNGPDSATAVAVRDTLPDGLVYVSHTPPGESYFVGPDGVWTWDVETVEGLTPRVLFLRTRVAEGTTGRILRHGATVVSADQEDPVPDNNTASNSLAVAGTDLALSLAVDVDAANEGDPLEYTLTLANHGPRDGSGIVVRDSLGAGLVFVEADPAAAFDPVESLWNVGALAAGAEARLTIRAVVDERTGGSGLIHAAEVLELDQVDPDGDNDQAETVVTVAMPAEGRILLSTLPLADAVARPLGDAVAVLGLELVNWSVVNDTLTTLTVANAAVGDGSPEEMDASWAGLELWRWDAENWSRIPGDGRLFNSSTARFENLGLVLTPGDTLALELRGRTGAAARDGDLLAVRLDASDALTFTRPVDVEAEWPLATAASVTVDGFVAAQAEVRLVGAGIVAPGELNRLVMSVVLPADGYDDAEALNELQVVNNGTARQDHEIEAVKAWIDDGDGVLVAGPDVLLGTMAWTGDRWRMSGLDRTIPTGGLPILVSIDASAGADGESSVQFAIPIDGVEVLGDADGPVDSQLVNKEQQRISGTDRLYMAAVVDPWSIAQADGRPRQVLHLTATNTFDEARTITSLRLTSDITSPYTDDQDVLDLVVAQLQLCADGGDDGVPGPDDEILAFSSLGTGTAVLGGFEWTVPPATTRHLFVEARLAPEHAADGDNITITVASVVDIQVDDGGDIYGDWPLDGGGGLVVDGVLADRIVARSTGMRTASPGTVGLLGLDVMIPANGHADDTLESFTVVNSGNAGSDDIASMTLWRDGGDGRFGAVDGEDPDDIRMADMTPRFGAWAAEGLSEHVAYPGQRFYVGVDLSPATADSAVVALAIPLGGLGYASEGDGPIDVPVSSGGSILASTSALHVALETDPVKAVMGQDVVVRLSVTNVSGMSLLDVAPTPLSATGDGGLDAVDGPTPIDTDLEPGQSVEFVWTRRAAAVGEVVLSAGAAGADGDASPVTSLPISAAPIRIAEPAPELRLAALSQLPFAVNGGQTDVNALVLDLSHPGNATAADVRLDSLAIRLEDGEGRPRNAGGVIERILLRADGALLLAADVSPEAGSVLVLTPDSTPYIPAADNRVLTIGLEISESAVGVEFRLVLGEDGLSVSDAVAGEPVGVLLNEGAFPVHSELTRVVDGAPALRVDAGSAGFLQASRGQTDVVLAHFSLSNPGVAELGAGIQLGVVVVDVVDGGGSVLDDPAAALRSLDLWHNGARLVRREWGQGATGTIMLPLDTPLSIEAGTPVEIEIRADLATEALIGGIGLAIADGQDWDARDANSGVPVPVYVDAAPLVTTPVTVVRPAESLQLGGRSSGSSVLTGGARGQTVLELDIRHLADELTAAAAVETLTVRCLDSLGRPLIPVAVMERLSVRSGERTVGTVVATAAPDGLLQVALNDVVCAPGGRVLLEVDIDVQANASVDTFAVEIGLDDVSALDFNLRTVVAATPDIGTGFPLSSGDMTIRVAADELIVAASDLMPATVASLGEDIPAVMLDLTNTAAAAAGDLALKSLTVQGRIGGSGLKSLGGVAGEFVAVYEGEVWGRSDALAAEDSTAVITGPYALLIGPGRTEELEIRFRVAEGIESGSVTVGLGLADIDVEQPEGDLVTVRVLPADGQIFPFWTLPGTISPPRLEDSYSNFPNPFAAGAEATAFVFALPAAATVDLRVYTPRGELVRTVVDAQPRDAGLHQDAVWDGRNGRGDTVRNGVYIAEIIVRESGGTTTTLRRKVAVVR